MGHCHDLYKHTCTGGNCFDVRLWSLCKRSMMVCHFRLLRLHGPDRTWRWWSPSWEGIGSIWSHLIANGLKHFAHFVPKSDEYIDAHCSGIPYLESLFYRSSLIKLCRLKEILHLNRWYRCNFICHRCHAHKDTFMVSPARLLDKQRCSAEEFFRVSVKPGKQCNCAFNLCDLFLCTFQTTKRLDLSNWCWYHSEHRYFHGRSRSTVLAPILDPTMHQIRLHACSLSWSWLVGGWERHDPVGWLWRPLGRSWHWC